MSKECGAGLVHICLHKTWDACAGIVFSVASQPSQLAISFSLQSAHGGGN